MISSKKITLISVILLACAIALVIWAGVAYKPQNISGITKTYGENEIVYDADEAAADEMCDLIFSLQL